MKLRFALGAVALWLCACGSGSPNNLPAPQFPKVPDSTVANDGGTTAVSPGCTPTTCAAQSRACGQVDDGCGAVLDCGTCVTGEQCNAAGACESIPSSCTPKTCAELGATCGSKDNGCGGVLTCGTCTTGQRCGTNSTCEAIPNNCTPTTCAAQSATCGTISNGCGGTLSCGSCDNGSTCGADHACHAAAPAGGSTAWTITRPNQIWDVASDASGKLFTVGITEGANWGTHIESLSSSGSVLASTETVYSIGILIANPTRDQLVLAGEDDSHPSPPMAVVLSSNKALTSVSQITGGTDVASFAPYAASPTGQIATYRGDGGWQRFQVLNEDGSVFYEVVFQYKFRPTGAGFDPNGNALVGGYLYGQMQLGGQSFGAEGRMVPAVFKFGPTGALIWGRTIDTDGEVAAFGVTSAGTGVALVSHQTGFSFAGASVSGGAGLSLVVYENSGAERVGTLVTSGAVKGVVFAVDPMGRAFVAHGNMSCDSTTVTKLNLAGAKEWTRTISGIGACDQEGTAVTALTVSNHAPVLAGFFDKPFDFGSGTVTPQGRDGFLMELQP